MMKNCISITCELIAFNTCNGNENAIAHYVGDFLADFGFDVKYPELSEGRPNMIAEKGISPENPGIVFSGHFDTVSLGKAEWSVDPFAGEIKDGKIYGRGSSDMKSSIVAMMCASIEAFEENEPDKGIRLVFTADEESGCNGANYLKESGYDLGSATIVIVGEPTANVPALGHKGGLFLNALTTGKTAHSSMPELGVNAIYKAAKAITKIEKLRFDVQKDSLLGFPTINVGMMNGGMNPNSVPDRAEFTVDVRTTTMLSNADALQKIKDVVGNDVALEPFVNLAPLFTDWNDPFIQRLYKGLGEHNNGKNISS